MPVPVHVPRVNNNDDEVKLIALNVALGEKISRSQIIAQVETEKAAVDVEAPSDGYVIAIPFAVESTLSVGSVMLWLGDTATESPPAVVVANDEPNKNAEPTAGARKILREHGLKAIDIPVRGERLTAADVEAYIAARMGVTLNSSSSKAASNAAMAAPTEPGEFRELRPDERGMLATVMWHRDVAAAGYIEIQYDPEAWNIYARKFAEQHRLLLNPLLSLMAWQLVRLGLRIPKINSTIIGQRRYEYSKVNLGFTVQAGDILYLTVVHDAASIDELSLVRAMLELQRKAAIHKLRPNETRGATLSFSSMARWKVARHIPILPPDTSIIVAHAAATESIGVLGASYDHRVLNGEQVVNVLRKLSIPPN